MTAGQQEEEAKRTRPRDHHWVTEAWILESVKAGARLSEHLFSPFQRKSGDIGSLLGPKIPTTERKDPPKRREAGDEHVSIEEDPGGFLRHFLANSRLHYIGTWRERALEQYLLMKDRTVSSCDSSYRASWLPASSSSSPSLSGERVVLHADMDCFFVSAVLASQGEAASHLRENLCEGPEKKIVPVAVAHSRGNSGRDSHIAIAEISSCNYSARRKGVKAGWPTNRALAVCPDLTVLDYDFAAYDRVIPRIYEVLLSFGERYLLHGENTLSNVCQVQIVSVDEAYLELPAGSDGAAAARELSARVMEVTGCRVSVGVGANKLLARLATKYAKPPNMHGIFVIDKRSAATSGSVGLPTLPMSGDIVSQESREEEEPERYASGSFKYGEVVNKFILPLNLRDLPDIGYKKEKALSSQGLITCRDVLRAHDDRRLDSLLEKANLATLKRDLLKLCTGEDTRPLTSPESYLIQKSIAVEVTWGVRFQTEASVLNFLDHLCRELQVRLRASTVTAVGKVIFKIKRRHASVPQTNFPDLKGMVAPGAKGALGHGKCDDYSLGTTFKASLSPTASALLPEVLKLYHTMEIKNNVEIIDLRGIGVQCSDLVRGGGGSSPARAGMRGGILPFVGKLRSEDNLGAATNQELGRERSKDQNSLGSEIFAAAAAEREVIDVSTVAEVETPLQRYEGLGLTESQEDMIDGLEDERVREEVLDQIKRNNHVVEAVAPVPSAAPYLHPTHNGRGGTGRRSTKPKIKLSRNDRTLTSMNLFKRDKESAGYLGEPRVEVDLTLDEEGEMEYGESVDSQAFSVESHLQGEFSAPSPFPFDEKQSPPSSFSRWVKAMAAERAPDENVAGTCRRYASLLVSEKRLDVALYYVRAVGRACSYADGSSREGWLAFWEESRRHLEGEVKARYGMDFSSA